MEKNSCCGCRACEQICPQKCIEMVEDSEGFIYPRIDKSKCINCGKCKKVCPMVNNQRTENTYKQKFYKLIINDKNILQESSSGGAFTAIVNSIFSLNTENKFKIYGSILDIDMKVKHIGIENIDELYRFRKSKYVQSNMQDCYTQIKRELKDNYTIIFTGTPCQVAGLKNFLNNTNTEKLYTIDIICHGVPSQLVFDEYIKALQKKYKSEVESFNFRERLKILGGVLRRILTE